MSQEVGTWLVNGASPTYLWMGYIGVMTHLLTFYSLPETSQYIWPNGIIFHQPRTALSLLGNCSVHRNSKRDGLCHPNVNKWPLGSPYHWKHLYWKMQTKNTQFDKFTNKHNATALWEMVDDLVLSAKCLVTEKLNRWHSKAKLSPWLYWH